MAVVVEPLLTEEKLRSLLAEKHEQSCLDYKRSLGWRAQGRLTGRCHLASPATTLIVVAMITAPMGNDSQACRSAVRRICLD